MQTGRAEEADAVTEVIRHYNRCRIPNRHPVIVESGTLQYVRVSVDFGFDPAFKDDLIRLEIADALGTNSGKSSKGDNLRGLFGIRYRSFERPEYSNSIVAAVQNIAGVKWAIVRVFSALPASDYLATIVLDSTTETFNDVVAPGPSQILSLYSAHLTLTAIAETVKGVC